MEEKNKHVHNVFEVLEYVYNLYFDCPISDDALFLHNIYYKLFICKKNIFKYEKLLYMKIIVKMVKVKIQPLIYLFLLENNLNKQMEKWNSSIENVNNISIELIKYYLNNN